VSPAFAATGATPSCTAVGVCDYLCPGGLNKCSGGCCAPACGAGLVACGGGAGGTCVVEDATACGPSCTHCPAGPVNGAAVCTAAHTCDVLCNTGTFRCGTSAAPACCSVAATPAAVALGGQHTCIIAEDTQGQNAGQVLCWGANDQGQLGDGTNVDRLAPVRVDLGGALAVAIAAGASHTCAALSGGGVKCWGSNSAGQLGVPASLASSHTPLDAAVTGVASSGTPLAAGSGHTCAVVAGGAVRCWGASSLGQLGNGSLSAALGPQQAGSLSGVGALTAGGDHTCALAAGGVWCWGANESGQVGGGSFATPVSSPTSVAFGAGISIGAVATGQAHSCAAVASGANARCWGLNAASQLGTKNNTASSASPVSAGSLDNRAVLVAAGAAHTCAAAQGVVTSFKCIGGPGIGLAGVGETIDVLLPAAQRLLRLFASGSVVSAGAGGQFGCMLVEPAAGATGAGPFRLWCWGVNDRGQFGNGATSTAPTPLAVQPVGQ
jgi:alpha-tubulin suppressor-like RCC1 family protein